MHNNILVSHRPYFFIISTNIVFVCFYFDFSRDTFYFIIVIVVNPANTMAGVRGDRTFSLYVSIPFDNPNAFLVCPIRVVLLFDE